MTSFRFVCPAVGCCLILAWSVQAQQPFTFTIVRPDLTQVNYGAVAFADVDIDGDFDVVGSGNRSNLPPYVPYSYLAISSGDYLVSNGPSAHSYVEQAIGEGLRYSEVAWTDYDRDGQLDFVVTGIAHSGAGFDNRPQVGQTRLYRNQGGTSFSQVSAGLRGLYGGALELADYDGDGDEDIFVSGFSTAERIETELYQNDHGRFVSVNTPFEPLALGDAGWVDYDKDGDLDLLLSGAGNTGAFHTRLYRNDGLTQFSEVNSGLPGLAFSSFDWGDYDNDGDPDLALSGAVLNLENYLDPYIQIWRNDNGRLIQTDISLASILDGDVAWGDYDNDGALDLLVTGGRNIKSARRGRIYRNEDGRFIERVAMPGVTASGVAWGDYDDDQDLDLLITGNNLNFNPLTRLYRNDNKSINTIPSAPSGLQATVEGTNIALQWAQGDDAQTPARALSYNIRVGTAPGTDNILRAYSVLSDGRRLRPDKGNAGQALVWRLRNLPIDEYYWSVQAIDHSLIGSPFSEEGTFNVTTGPILSTDIETEPTLETGLKAGYPNPFRIGSAVTIPYSLHESGTVEITIYNLLGSRVRHLVSDLKGAGHHVANWSGDDDTGKSVAPGMYFIRLQADAQYHTQQVTLMR